jgi:hypothetical protein
MQIHRVRHDSAEVRNPCAAAALKDEIGHLDIDRLSPDPRTKVHDGGYSVVHRIPRLCHNSNTAMLERVLSFLEQRLSLFLEKFSAFSKRLSVWAGWPRQPEIGHSLDAEAESPTQSFMKQHFHVNLAAGSSEAVAGKLNLPAAPLEMRPKPQKSTRFSITIRANGQEHTYDTTSGISDELANKLMDELGLPPEEFQTLLRLRQHRLQDAAAAPAKDKFTQKS